MVKVLLVPKLAGGLVGEWSEQNTLIKLSANQSLEGMKATLLHEAIHAQADAMEWNATEKTVLRVEKLLFSLIRNNPDLIRWLQNP